MMLAATKAARPRLKPFFIVRVVSIVVVPMFDVIVFILA